MTSMQKVYEAFIGLLESDEWEDWEEWERENDWLILLKSAIVWFKFPRISLELTSDGQDFEEELTNAEIQVIAAFMRMSWIERVINTGDSLRPLYSERDFSPAALLGEYRQKLTSQKSHARSLEATYYRSIKGKPYSFQNLAGGNRHG